MKKYFNLAVGITVILAVFLSGLVIGKHMAPVKYYLYTNNHHSVFKAMDSIGLEYTLEQKTAICKFLKNEQIGDSK